MHIYLSGNFLHRFSGAAVNMITDKCILISSLSKK